MKQFDPPEIWKRHVILFGIHNGNHKDFFSVWMSIWWQCRGFETNSMVITMAHQLRSLTPENVVGEVQSMTDNDPNKLIQLYDQQHENVWVSYQVSNAWRHSVFLIQDVKEPNFVTGQEERLHWKPFRHTQESLPTEHILVFLRWENFLPGSEKLLTCSVPTSCTDINQNQTFSPHYGVWGCQLRWWRYVPIHLLTWPQTQDGGLHQVSGGVIAGLDRNSDYWKTLWRVRELCSMPHKQKNLVLSIRNFLQPYYFKHLAAKLSKWQSLDYYMWNTVRWKIKTPYNIKYEQKSSNLPI